MYHMSVCVKYYLPDPTHTKSLYFLLYGFQHGHADSSTREVSYYSIHIRMVSLLHVLLITQISYGKWYILFFLYGLTGIWLHLIYVWLSLLYWASG